MWHFTMRHRAAFIFSVIGVLVFTSVVQAQDIQGTSGVDYPNYFALPETSFKCSEQKYNPGFYADLETKCQAFHFCYEDRQESFLCPTGTIFNQAVLTCDVWNKSNCTLAPLFYSVNAGPVMERAGKNLPMLLRLRNRSQSKPSTQASTTNVLDKVSSLYEADDKTADKNNENDASESKADSDDKPSVLSSEFDSKHGEQMISTGIELDSEKNAKETYEGEMSNENAEIETDEEMDTNIVYDPVTDGYYRKYDQYEEEWQGSEPENAEFNNFYDNRNAANELGAEETSESELNDYVESYENSDLTVVDDSEYPEFTRRSFQVGQSTKRLRRKPVYYVLDDELDSESENEESSKFYDSESSDTLENSDTRENKEMNLTSESKEESPDVPEDYDDPRAPTYSQSEQTDGEVSDSQSEDDTIYIVNDLEPESYAPYASQYEDIVSEPSEEAYEESYAESSDQSEADSSDTEDTFVVIPDEYDNAVDSDSNEDLQMSDYREENQYRTEMLADSSPSAAYSNYENYRDSSSKDYHPGYYEQTLTPAMAPELGVSQRWPGEFYQRADSYSDMDSGVYQNIMASDPRYSYQSGYEFQSQLPMNYESSSLDPENGYAYTEQYPYAKAELGVTDRPLELPVTEEDLDSLSTEDFNEVSEIEEDLMENPEHESEKPEDVYYVLDLDEEQPNEDNETISENEGSAGHEESTLEEMKHVEKQDNENKQLNSTNNATTSTSYVPLDTDSERYESDKIVEGWSSDLTEDEHINIDNGWSNSRTITNDEHPETNSDGWSSASHPISKGDQLNKDSDWSLDTSASTKDEHIKSPDVNSYFNTNPMNSFPGSNLEQSGLPRPAVETPYSSNTGSFDFSTDPRFLNNMGYSESMDFGPYGFGPNMGQFSMLESMQGQSSSGYSQRMGQTEQPKLSPLSAIQEKMRSMKQGKFGAFKKFMSSNK